MELTEKIAGILQSSFNAEDVRVSDDEGITGFVISTAFQNLSSLDRQKLINGKLRAKEGGLLPRELRRVLLISPLTPLEAAALSLMKPKSKKRRAATLSAR